MYTITRIQFKIAEMQYIFRQFFFFFLIIVPSSKIFGRSIYKQAFDVQTPKSNTTHSQDPSYS